MKKTKRKYGRSRGVLKVPKSRTFAIRAKTLSETANLLAIHAKLKDQVRITMSFWALRTQFNRIAKQLGVT